MSFTRTLLRPQLLRLRPMPSVRSISEIATLQEFRKLIDTPTLTVTDFHAVWCAPCRAIAPIIDKFAATYEDVQFLKVDVDQAEDIAQEYGVSAMPTFILFKDGEPIGKVVGAAPDKIKSAIEQYK